MAKTVTLEDSELERITAVMAYNLDANIQKELNTAMERKNEARIEQLIALKKSDQAILAKLYNA